MVCFNAEKPAHLALRPGLKRELWNGVWIQREHRRAVVGQKTAPAVTSDQRQCLRR